MFSKFVMNLSVSQFLSDMICNFKNIVLVQVYPSTSGKLKGLPRGIIHADSDLELRPLWSRSSSRSKVRIFASFFYLLVLLTISEDRFDLGICTIWVNKSNVWGCLWNCRLVFPLTVTYWQYQLVLNKSRMLMLWCKRYYCCCLDCSN